MSYEKFHKRQNYFENLKKKKASYIEVSKIENFGNVKKSKTPPPLLECWDIKRYLGYKSRAPPPPRIQAKDYYKLRCCVCCETPCWVLINPDIIRSSEIILFHYNIDIFIYLYISASNTRPSVNT